MVMVLTDEPNNEQEFVSILRSDTHERQRQNKDRFVRPIIPDVYKEEVWGKGKVPGNWVGHTWV